MNRAIVIILGAVLAVIWVLGQSMFPPGQLPASSFAPAVSEQTKLVTTVIDIPGPGGQKIKAAFYDLEGMPPFGGDDICALLREWIGVGDKSDSLAQGKVFSLPYCPDMPQVGENEGVFLSPRAAVSILPASHGDKHAELTFASTLARDSVKRLKSAASVMDVRLAVDMSAGLDLVGEIREGLYFKRFHADMQRLDANLCDGPGKEACRIYRLIEAGSAYAQICSLVDDEQHLIDAEQTLTEIEAEVASDPDLDRKIGRLETIASAYGYAGESGRRESLVKRALDISRKNLAEIEAAGLEENASLYDDALEHLSANIGRYAFFTVDTKSLLEESVLIGTKFINRQIIARPDSPSWTAYANRAADRTELFRLTRDQALLPLAIADAAQAVLIVGNYGAVEDMGHSRFRLGDALALQAVEGAGLDEPKRIALAQEAQEDLSAARAVYEKAGSSSYVGYIAKSQDLIAPLLKKANAASP